MSLSTDASLNTVNTPVVTGGASGGGGYLSNQKDAKDAATETKFGDIWQKLQNKYGEKPEKPREIKKTLGKDDFLKIMTTQMKYQDPTEPFKAEQMASEMAQFASVEQLSNLNQSMAKMANQNQPLERLAMTNMIGKKVTVDRDRFQHAAGAPESLSFTLNSEAQEVKVQVISEAGETIFEKDMGAQKSGNVNFEWDGKKGFFDAKPGLYLIRVDAKDQNGKPVQAGTQIQAKVVGVSYEGSDPVFLVGDAKNQQKISIKNIIKVESDPNEMNALGQRPAVASAEAQTPEAAPVQAAPDPTKNFFAFQKGVGSRPLNPAEAANVYQQQAQKEVPVEKGFPNGLTAEKGGDNP